ncbi:MAG: hypothetical protein ACYCSB_01655 [bacterium]
MIIQNKGNRFIYSLFTGIAANALEINAGYPALKKWTLRGQ